MRVKVCVKVFVCLFVPACMGECVRIRRHMILLSCAYTGVCVCI